MSSVFSDLSGAEWFYADAAYCHQLGLITGYPGGRFYPPDCPPDLRPLYERQAVIAARQARADLRIRSLELARVVDLAAASVVEVRREGGAGSAVAVGPGRWLTCAHVVTGAEEVKVSGGAFLQPARVVATDANADLALLEGGPSLPGVTWREDALPKGTEVLAVGNSRGLGVRATLGIIASLGELVAYRVGELIRVGVDTDHTAMIAPGNSGGALFEAASSRCVGITNARHPAEPGMAYAVPAGVCLAFLRGQGVVR